MGPNSAYLFILRSKALPYLSPTAWTSRRYMATRTYAEAVQQLNSLQSNAAVLDSIRASGGRSNIRAIPESIEYLTRIGYSVC